MKQLDLVFKVDVPVIEEVAPAFEELDHFFRRQHPPHQIVSTSAAEVHFYLSAHSK